MRSIWFATALSALIPLILSPSHEAMGQEQQAAGTLEEVIVTARRREETLMETPVSISAFTADELTFRQIEQSHEIADATPNLVYRNIRNSSNIAGIIFIRGIGQSDFIPTVQPGVGTYIDGAYVANITGAISDLVDVESISVLRGPQGTLFGRNTIGGAIQITSVKPNDEFGGDVEVSLGEDNYEMVKATINVPFTDNFYGRFTALSRKEDGYIDTVLIPDDNGLPGEDLTAARVALRWLPTDALTIDWSFDTSDRQSNGPPAILQEIFEEIGPVPENGGMGSTPWQYNTFVQPLTGGPIAGDQWAVGLGNYTSFVVCAPPGCNADADVNGSTLTVEWDISDNLTFKSITNWREQESFDGRDADITPAEIQPTGDVFDGWQRSQEIQLLGNALDGRLNWVAGLYTFEEDMLNINIVPFPIFRLISGSHVQNESDAIFGQFTFDVTDKLSLTIGGRNTDENFDSVVDDNIQWINQWFCGGPPTPPPVTPFCAAQPPGFIGYVDLPPPPQPGNFRIIPNGVFEADESRTEPYVNLSYNFTDNVLGYVSYSEGFKGGGFTQRLPPGRPVFAFGPEFAEVVELGVKWTGLDNRLRLTAAVFNTDYLDLQVPAASLLGNITVNASDAEINGGELELLVAPTDRLQFALGVGHLQARYKELKQIDILGNPAAVGFSITDVMPDAPDWQTNASVTYRAPLPGGELILRLDHTYSDSYFTNAQNTPGTFVPSNSLFNGGVTYVHDSDRWEVGLQARNLTDEFYFVDVVGNIFSNGVLIPIVGPPRQIHARFKYRF